MDRHQIQFPPKHLALREDVHQLGVMVGEMLREQGGEELYQLVEGDRRAAIERRDHEGESALELQARVAGPASRHWRATWCARSPPGSRP